MGGNFYVQWTSQMFFDIFLFLFPLTHRLWVTFPPHISVVSHTQATASMNTLLWVLLGPYSLKLNFKHSSQYISHRCHHAHGVYIPVCIRGVELRARCDRQRLTVERDVFMFTVIHTHTHIHTHRVLQSSNFTTGNIWKDQASIHHL